MIIAVDIAANCLIIVSIVVGSVFVVTKQVSGRAIDDFLATVGAMYFNTDSVHAKRVRESVCDRKQAVSAGFVDLCICETDKAVKRGFYELVGFFV
jgi:hypothetical protein